ncbi:tenascin-X-like [Ambystoma mexicanum]|uniref:tenascin-X-like n=1 Tax=Ambystoma mexicanum TaxID=8296 RepID=UPI0037E7EE83
MVCVQFEKLPNVTNHLIVSDVSIDFVSLSWLAPTGNRSSYLIQVLGNPSRNVTVLSEFASINNLIPGNLYTFLVSAVAGDGSSGNYTSISKWTVPNVTNHLIVSDVSIDFVSLSWLAPTGNRSSYLIQVLGNPSRNVTVFSEVASINNLIPGNLYTFLVSAVAGDGSSGNDTSISKWTVPNVTNHLIVSDVSINFVSLSWLAPTGNRKSYLIQVLGNPSRNVTAFTEVASINHLIPGNLYTFLVSAVAGDGSSGNDTSISKWTVPNVTNHLIVSDVSIDFVSLSWLAPTGNRSSYLIQVLGNPSRNVTVFSEVASINNLIPGNLYTFLVSAVAGDGSSGNYTSISKWTVPNVTNHLIVSDVSIDFVSLSWLAPTGNRSSYLIQVLGNPSRNVTVFSEVASINNLIPGNLYTFLVSAVAGDGSSGNDTSISKWTAPNVTNKLNVTEVSINSVSLSWLPPTGNKSSYLIQVLGNPSKNYTVVTEFASILDLLPGNPYTFLVSAVAGDGSLGKTTSISTWTVAARLSTSLQFSSSLLQNERKKHILSKLQQQIERRFPGQNFTLTWTGEKNNYCVIVQHPEQCRNHKEELSGIDSLKRAWGGKRKVKEEAVAIIQPGENQSSGDIEFPVEDVEAKNTSEEVQPKVGLLGKVSNVGFKEHFLSNVSDTTEAIKENALQEKHSLEEGEDQESDFTTATMTRNGTPQGSEEQQSEQQLQSLGVPSPTPVVASKKTVDVNPRKGLHDLLWEITESVKQSTSMAADSEPEAAIIAQVEHYKALPILPGNEDPLIWWKQHQKELPILSHLAQKYLCIPATSVPSERVFSSSGYILSPFRSRLSTEHVNMLGERGVLNEAVIIDTSPVLCVADLGLVRNITLTPVSITTLLIGWAPPEDGASSYLVEVLGTPSLTVTVTAEYVNVTGLIPGNYYSVQVSAQAGPRQGDPVTISGYTLPNVTNNLIVSNVTIDSVSLTWLPPTGNKSSYAIDVLGEPSSNFTCVNESLTIFGLTPGNLYKFFVSAISGDESKIGKSSSVITYTVPNVTNNLIVSNVTIDSVSLTWLPPTGNKSSYAIDVLGEPSSNFTWVNESLTIFGLTPGNLYTFFVSAIPGDESQTGKSSSVITYTVPNVTNNLIVRNVTIDSVSLTWLPPTGNKSSYAIDVLGEPSSNFTWVNESLTIFGLTPGNLYTFFVSAIPGDESQTGKSSSVITYTVPNVTNNLIVRNVTIDSVSLTWLPPTGNKSSYAIDVLGEPSSNFTWVNESLTIFGLTPGNLYTFFVSAISGDESQTGKSSSVITYTVPNVTNNLIVSNVTIDSVSLTWLPPTGNKSSYAIDVLGEPSSNFTWVNESLTIFGLTPGNLYTFFVSAISGDESQTGKSSSVITYTVPNVTNNLIVSNVTIDSVSLTWLPPTGNKSSYAIDVLGEPSSNFTWVNESLTIFGLTPGNLYTFFVSAISGDESKIGKSSLVITYTVPNVITEVDVINVSVDSVSLTWPPPNGNRSFYVVNISGDPAGVVIVDLEAVSIPHLIPGNLYTFHVSALSGDQALQGAGSSVSTYTVPSIINNLIISTFSNDSVSLRWDPPTGNKSFYIVEVSADPFSWNVTCVNESVTFDNLVLGTLYTFLVSAVAGDGISKGMSASIEYFGPTQINMLQVVTASIDAVTLEWLPPIGNKDSYLVNVSGDPARTARVYNESAFISDLVPGNLYTFCVSALSDNGSLQGSITCVSNYTVPNVTNQLSVSDVSIDSVSLSWLPPTGNRSYYSVEVSGEPASSRRVDSESVTIHKLIPGNLYTFFVSAVSGDGSLKGENRSVVSYTIPNVTNDLRVTELPGGSVSLTWLPPTGNRSFYLVEVFGDPASFVTVVDEHVNISDLMPGNLYTFSVSAVAADGLLHGNSSSVTHRVTVLISNLSVSGVSIDAVSLSWLLPSGPNFSYLVEVLGVPDSNVTAASTSVSINNLVTGNFYTFLISVILGDGSLQEKTFSISTYTVPNITNNLNISAVSIDSVSLSWLPPTGNKGYYVVEVLGVPASSQTVYDNSLTISNLIPGNLYTFLVSAVAGDGSSQGKSSSRVIYTVPNITNNLNISAVSIDSVSLSWLPPTGNKSYYVVEVLGVPASSQTVYDNSLTISNLIPGNLYTFLVSAVAGDGSSKGKSSSVVTCTVPNITNNLNISAVSIDSVSLSWLPPTGNKSYYVVEVLGVPASSQTVYDNSLSISNLIPGNLYTFLVSAVAGDGSSKGKSSSVVTYTVPNITNNLNISAVSIDSVSLTWLPPTGNKSSYAVEVLGVPAYSRTLYDNSLSISNLIPGNLYTFLVSAVAGDGLFKGKSSSVVTYTVPNITNNLNFSAISINSVSLSWLPPTGNKSYYVVEVLGVPASSQTVYDNSLSISNLIPGNLYTFLVSAVAGDGSLKGKNSSVVTCTVPNITNNLNISAVSIDSVSLSWLPPTGNKSYYVVEVLGVPASSRTVYNNSLSISNLIPGNLYTFLVSAVAGNGSLKGKSSSFITYTLSNITNNLNISAVSIDSVSLSWLPPTGNKSYYVVEVLGVPASSQTVYDNSLSISNLIPGNLYTFLVSAVAGDGSSKGKSSSVVTYTVPNITNNLNISAVSIDSVSLSWLPPTGNKSYYVVEVLGVPASSQTVYDNSLTISNLTPGNLYTFLVSAVAGDGSSKGKSSSVVTCTVPNITNNLNISAVSIDSVSLSWLPPTGNKSSYAVEVLGVPASSQTVYDNSLSISNLIPGNLYTFLVSAVAGDGSCQGKSSSVVTYTVPNITNNLNISAVSIDSVSLTWLPPTGNKSSYAVEVLGVPAYSRTLYDNSLSISNLIPGNLYTFLVSAVAGDGLFKGKSSSVVTYTVPNITNNLNFSAISINSVSLSWLPPTGNKSYYVVEVLGVPASSQTVYDNSLSISNLIPGNLYTFLVSAVAGDGSSKGKSSSVVTCTVPNITNNLNISAVSIDSVSLSWLPPTGNKSYYVVEVLGVPASSQTVYDNSLSISNLIPGNLYTFLVSAVAGDGSSKGKSSSVVTYTVPNITNNLNFSAISINSVSLSWLPPTGNKSYYVVEVLGVPASSQTVYDNSLSISNLIPGNLYTFLVSAVAGDGSSKGKSSSVVTYTVPNLTNSLSISAVSINSVSLVWLPPTGNKSSYLIEVFGEPRSNMTLSSNSASISNLIPGNLYTILVSALSGDGSLKGKSSSIMTYTVPNVIRNLTVTATTFDSVSLNWLPPTGNRSSYSVQVLGIPPTLMTVQSESVSIDKLTAGNLYTFVVSAVAGDGTMGKNSSTSAYTDNSRLYISLQLSASVGENQQKVYMLSQLQRQIEGQFPGENFTLTWTRENPT